jgi:hypothetical protein
VVPEDRKSAGGFPDKDSTEVRFLVLNIPPGMSVVKAICSFFTFSGRFLPVDKSLAVQ